MKRRSIWLTIGLLIAAALFAFAGCKGEQTVKYVLSETAISLTVGQKKQLTVSPEPEKSVAWESGDESVATVENGAVKALSAGSTTVTAKIEGVNDALTCTVMVTAQPVQSDEYALDFASVSLKTGESKQISVIAQGGGTVSGVTYTSADPSVATVSQSGLITAVGKGETAVKAEVGGAELICNVTVAQKYTYSLDKSALDIAAGASEKLTLVTTPDDGGSSRPHTFSSSDENVATVNGGTGKVTGVAKGTATITCLVDGEELTATVTVTEYTVKIDGEAMTEETDLRVGTEKTVAVTADPAREVSPVYASDDESVVKVENGKLVALKEGSASVTVTVGGRVFRTTVNVLPAVTYAINEEELKLDLGGTFRLEVTRDPAGTVEATFASSDGNVATVAADGTVTAKGVGSAVITTSVAGTETAFTTAVTVVLPSELSHEDYTFGSGAVNLTYLDANKTVDWRQYYNAGNIPTRMKNNAGLIGDYTMLGCDDEKFWDYKAPVMFDDAEGDVQSGVYTYGRAVHGSFTIPVTVTNAVSKVVIFTGSWKEAATIEFRMGDSVLQSEDFAGGDPALARKYELAIDTSALKDGETLELTIAVNCPRTNGGNVALVAVAAIGKEAHGFTATASATASATTGLTGEQNLTEAGAIDWISANGARKAGVPADAVVKGDAIAYAPGKGTATDYPGATFGWTDGTAEAPQNLKTFHHADVSVTIPVVLDKGKTTVTVFATGWNCGYLVAVYDKNGHFVNAYQGADEKANQSVSSKLAVTLNVAEAGEYTFKLLKCRGEGNIGWAAVAVSGANEAEPDRTAYSLKEGEEVTVSFGGKQVSAQFASDREEVVTVDADGKITAVGGGKAVVTATYAGVERRIFVTVTGYSLTSESSLTLPLEATSQIVVTSTSGADFTATYETSDDSVATVSDTGLITAVKAGNAVITVKVESKTFTVNVKVEAYKLSDENLLLIAGKDQSETKKISVLNGSDEAVAGATFASSDENVAEVSEDGTVTAVAVGTATVTATTENGVSLACKVTVTVPDTEEIYTELDMQFENLSRVSSEYKTIDYKHWSNEATVEMLGGAGLIGEPSSTNNNFWDYKTTIGYEYAEGGRNLGKTYGKTSKGFELPVRINSGVSAVVFYTGAYHGTATVTFKLGEKTLATRSFEADAGVARKFELPVDTSKMISDATLTVIGSFEGQSDGNINVVAIAVIGKVAYSGTEIAAAAGTVTAEQVTGDKGSNKVDLTGVGTLDWIYSHYENPNDKTYRKFGGTVFTGETYYSETGERADAGAQWDGFSAFSWTDGVLTGSEAEEGASNPSDSNEGWEGSNAYTNNYFAASGEIHIALRLSEGKYKITAYLNSYRAAMSAAVYDGNGNFIVGKHLVGESNSGTGWVVTFTLDVTQESTFNLVLGKSRSHGEKDRQVGWQAVAVAALPDEKE